MNLPDEPWLRMLLLVWAVLVVAAIPLAALTHVRGRRGKPPVVKFFNLSVEEYLGGREADYSVVWLANMLLAIVVSGFVAAK